LNNPQHKEQVCLLLISANFSRFLPTVFEIRATKLDFCKLFAEIEQLFYKKLADFKRIFSKTKKL